MSLATRDSHIRSVCYTCYVGILNAPRFQNHGHFWLELGFHAYVNLPMDWFTGEISAKSKPHFLFYHVLHPFIHRGLLHPAHTGYLKNKQNAWPPDENNHALWWKHRQGRGATIHITPELFHGGYFSMIVVGNSWCLKDLQYHNVSHEKYPCPTSSDWFVDRYSVSNSIG